MAKIAALLKSDSLRKSLVLYVSCFLLLALALSALSSSLCSQGIEAVRASYTGEGQRYWLTNEQGERLGEGVLILDSTAAYTEEDQVRLDVLDAVRTASPAIWSAICILAAAFLFYHNRLKGPLEELQKASRMIAADDLNFTIHVEREDELGELCRSCETMRAALAQNFSNMWRQVDERRQLNRAFSHDLRTPLTVLKGYCEMLQGSGDPQTRETAVTMARQIRRMEDYVASMGQLQRLEDARPAYRTMPSRPFLTALAEEAEMLCRQQGMHLITENLVSVPDLTADEEFVSQVCSNLLSNALRYAASEIILTFALDKEARLALSVTDDGPGFSPEGLEHATEPYFSGEKTRSEHFGIGLTICRLLCEAHGGGLRVGNGAKGALVTATFQISGM